VTFLIIGVFHPLVIKGEYYFGHRCRWWFAAAGVVFLVLCLLVNDLILSILLGVVAFSCFWSIHEVDEQVERVRKGWFPKRNAND
jgi:fatty acid desaturase